MTLHIQYVPYVAYAPVCPYTVYAHICSYTAYAHVWTLYILGSTSQQYKYTLLVITGNQVGSTSNADVYVTLHGGGGATERVWVDKCHLKRGHTHRVEVLSPVLVDPVDKICVGHDSPGHETSWYLEKVCCPQHCYQHW